jgi:hypothetical protein
MIYSIPFFRQLLRQHISGVHTEHISITGTEKNISALWLTCENNTTSRGTIFLVNGFSVYGNEDPRIIHLAKAICHMGFHAIIPSFPDINALRINPGVINEMADCIQHIALNDSLCKKGKLTIIAPSYSAGLALKACSDNRCADKLSSILLIGTYFTIEDCLHFLMHDPTADDYGRNILLRNFLPYSTFHRQELMPLIDMAISDNGFKKRIPGLPVLLKRSHPDVLAEWMRMQHDPAYRLKILHDARKGFSNHDQWLASFDLASVLHSINSPVFLLHGKNDNVVPSNQSSLLHKALGKLGKQSYLCISPLIDHGDLQKSPSTLLHTGNLILFFNHFFRTASVN